ncbi:MAG: hypothetical protein J5680_06350 [Neisseriaceae bacterium]|nr:hypothetical protein [Neisseriaceae bacterium]
MKFSQEVIDNICYSMENTPDEWDIGTYTVEHISGIELWFDNNSFTYWNGHSSDNVFTDEERKRIKESFEILRTKKQSLAQRRITKAFSKSVVVEKKSDSFLSRLFNVFK